MTDWLDKRHVRTYIRPIKGVQPESTQREHARGTVYVEGKDTRDKFIASLRRGDVALVLHLALLAEPKGRKQPDPLADLERALEAIEAKGAIIYEAATGRRSDRRDDWRGLLLDAARMIRRGRRGWKAQGRPKRTFTADEMVIIEREWFNLKRTTNAEAIAAMKAKGVQHVSRTAVYRLFGKSGRR